MLNTLALQAAVRDAYLTADSFAHIAKAYIQLGDAYALGDLEEALKVWASLETLVNRSAAESERVYGTATAVHAQAEEGPKS